MAHAKTPATRKGTQLSAPKKSQPSGPRREPPHLLKTPEPDLIMLLDEPEVRLLMRADHVDEHGLMAMFNAVRVQLRNNSAAERAAGPPDAGADKDDRNYRPGVGVMLLNARGEIFVGRRADMQHDAWQMPQGGIDEGETPQHAAMRELKEEIRTNSAEIIAESRGWLYYDVPEELARKAWAGRWKGQRQKWFVMLFKGDESEINLDGEHPEFSAWRWAPVQELTELAVSFKRQMYLNVLGEFATIFRD